MRLRVTQISLEPPLFIQFSTQREPVRGAVNEETGRRKNGTEERAEWLEPA